MSYIVIIVVPFKVVYYYHYFMLFNQLFLKLLQILLGLQKITLVDNWKCIFAGHNAICCFCHQPDIVKQLLEHV